MFWVCNRQEKSKNLSYVHRSMGKKSVLFSTAEKRLIGPRRDFLRTIGLNELRIRPADTTHIVITVSGLFDFNIRIFEKLFSSHFLSWFSTESDGAVEILIATGNQQFIILNI